MEDHLGSVGPLPAAVVQYNSTSSMIRSVPKLSQLGGKP